MGLTLPASANWPEVTSVIICPKVHWAVSFLEQSVSRISYNIMLELLWFSTLSTQFQPPDGVRAILTTRQTGYVANKSWTIFMGSFTQCHRCKWTLPTFVRLETCATLSFEDDDMSLTWGERAIQPLMTRRKVARHMVWRPLARKTILT